MAHQSQEEEEDVADAWVTDLSITIQPGKIKPCSSVSVELFGSTKEKYSKYMGLYTLRQACIQECKKTFALCTKIPKWRITRWTMGDWRWYLEICSA